MTLTVTLRSVPHPRVDHHCQCLKATRTWTTRASYEKRGGTQSLSPPPPDQVDGSYPSRRAHAKHSKSRPGICVTHIPPLRMGFLLTRCSCPDQLSPIASTAGRRGTKTWSPFFRPGASVLTRRPNAELRTREHLTAGEIEALVEAAKARRERQNSKRCGRWDNSSGSGDHRS
jgi:hypothetical protein